MMKKSLLPQAPFRRFLRLMSLILILAVMLSTSLVANSITVSISNALTEQTFTLYPEDGVTVTLSGRMPLNGSAEAKPADCDEEDVLHAYDITIRYADGREFEPESGSPIDVSFKSDRIALAVGRENELTAEHISDSGETEEVPLTVSGSSEASFTADSFSVYKIRAHENAAVETPRKTFMFLSNQFDEYEHTGDVNNPQAGYYVSGLYQFPNKDNEKVSFQIVKNQEKLQPVVIPPNFDWGHFYGWYIVTLDLEKSKQATAVVTGRDVSEITKDTLTRYVYEWPANPVAVDSVTPIEVTQDETVYLAPLYSNYRFVTFHEHDHTDDGQSCNIIMRKIIVLGSNGQCEVDISDVVADSPDPQNYVFYGWKFNNTAYQTRLSTGDVVHQTITVTEQDIQQQTGQGDDDEVYSVDVYPIFKEARWITFVHGESGWNAKYVPAMFSFLYDTSIPEEQRVSISQLPSTTRPGYIFDGWYTGRMEEGEDGVDHIVYDQQVSMSFDEEGATGNSQIISTAGERIYLYGGNDEDHENDTYLFKGKLYLRDALTLYAKWAPVNSADYKVVVWKQKVTDSKTVEDSKKQYDYYDYRIMENCETGSIILDSPQFNALGLENLTNSTDTSVKEKFNFFHYSRTTVEVGGQVYDGSIPAQRAKGVVAPDGSTVVNIYYDRDLMAINFYYKNNAPQGATTAFTYTKTDETSGTYYGLTPSGYQQLHRENTPETYYTYTYRYNLTDEPTASNMYGVVNNEYVPLTIQTVYTWTPEYVYTPVDKSTYHADGYAVYNGEYVTAYYNNNDGKWYRSRTWLVITYSYSNPIEGNVYTRAAGTEPYTGTRYTRSGRNSPYTYNAVQPTNTGGTQYMVDQYGGHIKVTATTAYTYSYNGESYTGLFYTRTNNTDNSLVYDGTLYKKVNGAMVPLGEGETADTVYGTDENNYYEQLTPRTQAVYTWSVNVNGEYEKYTGPRYTRSSKSGFSYMLTWTGLYGQTFAQNGYSWDTVHAYAWKGIGADGKSSTQTLLDGFSEAKNPYDLEQGDSTGNNVIYHYKQKIDGTYDVDNPYQANYSGNNTTFNFTNKFDGFTVAGYSSTFNANFDRDHLGNGEQAVQPTGSTATLTGNTIHIYHTRNAFELTLANFTTTNNSPNEPNDKVIPGIKYEQCLNTIAEADRTPPPRENYTFDGWYYDKAFTKKVKFDEAYMPDSNLILYANWVLKYYFVEIDPNGGEIEDALEFSAYTGFDSPRKQSTYTWVQFGGKIGAYDNVERHYIPDPNGEYRYVNVKFAETFAQAAEKSWDDSLPSQYRAAFYCNVNELETVYNEHFSERLDHDFFMNYCVDRTQLYRLCSGKEGFTLAAWYKVNDDGTTSHDIYNFGDTVTKPTRIRAVWRKLGEYTIEYNPYMRRYAVGGYVEQDGVMHHNETHIDPSEGTKYTDEATATIYTQPNYIPDGYIFRGWQLLDSRLHETGQYFNPRSEFTIDSSYADNNGVIHFEAAYEPDKESVRRVDTVSLVLDANTDTGGYVVKNGLDVYEDYAYVDLTQNQVLLKKQPNNVAVNLRDYYNNFHNSHGYMLIGWNDEPTAENFIPKYPADAVIGVDSKNMPATNKLYAIWEPMYYLTLENHSTEYDVSFNLQFTDYEGVVYSNDTNHVVSVFEREVFSAHNADNLTVTKKGDGEFDVTLKAGSADAPNGVKLVLPQGDRAHYIVSGDIQGTPITAAGKTLTVFNSGGANATANTTGGTAFSVNGSMIHSEEGQTVAFYTEELPHTKISLKACYYDPGSGTWQPDDDASDSTGPNPTLSFENLPPGITQAEDTSITLDIMDGHYTKTFSIKEAFANTAQYKFIGWFSKDNAAPRDRSIDNQEFGAAKVTGMTATNDPIKNYYALYVPYSDGTLTLSHDESQTSIGYPKKLSIGASYDNHTDFDEETTHIKVEDSITHAKVHTEITFANFQEPRTTEDAQTAFNITLNAMSGYGCVHYNTYEEGRPLDDRISDESTVINVYMDPDNTNENHPEGAPVETKHYYRYVLNRTVGDMFTDSETVKGYKTIKNIRFYSDFERKYEFVYNYIFRDGTTVRKYQVKDATAYLKSEREFRQFVFESAPYISNFGEDFVWQPSSITVNNLYGKGQVTATMDAVQTKSATAHVIVKRFDASIPWAIDVGTAFPKGKRPTADLIINSQQFLRWKVEDTNTKKLIGYCYSPEFSFVVWGDYTITPEYIDMSGDEYEYISPTHETESYVTLDYLDSTRNQWVGLDENNNIIVDAKGVATQHYDSLISDFSMVFVDHGHRINTDADNYKLGLIFEVVGEIENTNIPDQYTVTPDDELRERAINAITGSSSMSGSLKRDGKVKFYYSQIDPTTLSDANRIEYYRGISNLLGTNGELNPNAKYVFNVYAYMKKLSDGTIYQSNPVTLQMYNLAVRTVTG